MNGTGTVLMELTSANLKEAADKIHAFLGDRVFDVCQTKRYGLLPSERLVSLPCCRLLGRPHLSLRGGDLQIDLSFSNNELSNNELKTFLLFETAVGDNMLYHWEIMFCFSDGTIIIERRDSGGKNYCWRLVLK